MQNNEIDEFIVQENADRRQKASNKARQLISDILNYQDQIRQYTESIETAREELRTLEVTEVTAAEILG